MYPNGAGQLKYNCLTWIWYSRFMIDTYIIKYVMKDIRVSLFLINPKRIESKINKIKTPHNHDQNETETEQNKTSVQWRKPCMNNWESVKCNQKYEHIRWSKATLSTEGQSKPRCPKMLKVAQYRHGIFSTEDTDSENEGRFPCVYLYPLCSIWTFSFSGGVNDCDSNCNWGSDKEFCNSLACIFALGICISTIWDSIYIVEHPKAVAPFPSRR